MTLRTHVDAAWSIGLAYGLMFLLPLVLFTIQRLIIIWHRHRGRKADEAYEAKVIPTPGDAIIHGRVELDAGTAVAVRTTVHQVGSETKSKSNWSHEWKEVDRAVEVAPFYLIKESGRRVRVEPDPNVLHIDEMDTTEVVDRTHRTRVAELTEGEAVFAAGELVEVRDSTNASNYREGGRSLCLRPPRDGRMLLSAQPLGDRFRAKTSVHHGFSIALWVIVGLFQLIALGYHVRRFGGVADEGRLIKKRHYTTTSKGNKTDHWELTVGVVSLEDPIVDDVVRGDFFSVEPGDTIPVIRVAFWEARSRLGNEVTLSYEVAAAFLVIFLIYFGIYVAVARRRSWWDGKLTESGAGRLPEPPPSPDLH